MIIFVLVIAALYFLGAWLNGKRFCTSRRSAGSAMCAEADKFSRELERDLERAKREAEKQAERRRIMEEKQRKQAQKEAERAEKLEQAKLAASSDLEFLRHRIQQLDRLLYLAEDRQEGTVYGSKDWLKYEHEIMKLESQSQALKQKARKARATMNK